MRRFLALAVFIIAASPLTSGQTPAPSPSQTDKPTEKMAAGSPEQEINRLEKGMQDGMLKDDMALFEKVATDDYLVINPLGVVGTKADALAGSKSWLQN